MLPSANRERQPNPTEVHVQITRKKKEQQTVHTDARRHMTMMFVNAALDILQRQQQYEVSYGRHNCTALGYFDERLDC